MQDIPVYQPVLLPARTVLETVAAGGFPPLDVDASNVFSQNKHAPHEHVSKHNANHRQCNRTERSDTEGLPPSRSALALWLFQQPASALPLQALDLPSSRRAGVPLSFSRRVSSVATVTTQKHTGSGTIGVFEAPLLTDSGTGAMAPGSTQGR